MSDKFSEFERQEAERIARFRAERAKAIEAEKAEKQKLAEAERNSAAAIAERERKAEEQRKEAEAQRAEAEREAAAKALIPDDTQVEKIRKQILRQRRNRKLLNFMQFLVFVLVPTALVGYYNSEIAVPLYEARSVVTVTKPGGQSEASLPGMLGSVLPQANMNEAFMAQEYIGSHEMMTALEDDIGLLSYYGSEKMDQMQRLRDIVSLQIGAESFYRRYVKTSINIQTGLLTLYVAARTPDDAKRFSLAILNRAESHIRALSEALFHEQIAEAQVSVERARDAMEQARRDLTALQISSGLTNPRESVTAIYAAISALEGELLQLQSKIDETELSGYADSPQMAQLQDTKTALERRIQQQKDKLTDTSNGPSLNAVLADYEFLLVQIQIAEQTWAAALTGLEHAQSAAALGVSHFQIVVPPSASDIATYPNRIKSTLLAFLVFFGLFSAVKVFRPKIH